MMMIKIRIIDSFYFKRVIGAYMKLVQAWNCVWTLSCGGFFPLPFDTIMTSWLHRASNNVETLSLPTDAHNVKKHRVVKTF